MSPEYRRAIVVVEAVDAAAFEDDMRLNPRVENFSWSKNPVITNQQMEKYASRLDKAHKSGETRLSVKGALAFRNIIGQMSDETRIGNIPVNNRHRDSSPVKINDDVWDIFQESISFKGKEKLIRVVIALKNKFYGSETTVEDVRKFILSGKTSKDIPNVGPASWAYIMIVFCAFDREK